MSAPVPPLGALGSAPAIRTPAPGGHADRARLDRALLHGIAWTGMVKWATQVLSWFSTLFVARLLTRADYGIAGMAFVYIGFVQLINELGISAAVVQRRDLTRVQVARLGGLSAMLGIGFCLVSIALAHAVAGFFGEPAVFAVVVALSTTFAISGLQVLPRAVLTRDMEFRKLASVEGIEALTQTVVTLTLAIAGMGYWAIIAGLVAGRAVSTGMLLVRHHHPLAWPRDFQSIAGPVRFGAHLVVGNVAWYAFRNADSTLIGRLLGTAALGAYSVGGNLASIPVDRVTALVSRVTPAIFASVQNKPAELRRYLFGLTEALALVTFPLAVGMALVVEEGVLVVLGEEWRAAIVPLRLLALAAAYRSIVPLLNQVLVATGQARTTMVATLVSALILPILFYLGTFKGLGGVALVWLAAFPVVSLATLARPALRACEMPLRTYLRATWPAVSSVAVMSMGVFAAGYAMPASSPLSLRLTVKALTGAIVYSAVVLLLYRDRISGFIAILRRSRERREPGGA